MKSVKFGIVVFPGSNCDHDAYHVAKQILGQEARFIWHKESDLFSSDVIILPGGFSYGDYLRTGAIAQFSPVMKEVVLFAKKGGIVLGICNGFQILLESGLLPGAMVKNRSLKFSCKQVSLLVTNSATIFTSQCNKGEVLTIPIAHGEGNYAADEKTLQMLQDNKRIVFQYSNAAGETDDASNPNGSMLNIAGIINEEGNVLGMMPHPERAADIDLGSSDGMKIFSSIVETVLNNRV